MKKPNPIFETKVYRLASNKTPLAFMLSSRHNRRSPLLYFDEETGVNRPLRYARNQKSPFEDEQDGNAILEPIVFEDGMLVVPKENQVLQKFLHIHPGNGTIFYEINKKKEAKEELEYVEAELDAQILARNLSLEKLVSVCRVFLGAAVDNMSTPELKRDVLIYAKNQPFEFLEVLDDPMLDLQDKVSQFFSEGLLAFRNNQKDVYFNLKKNKSKILTIPFGEDPNYIVASYMQSDEGIETFKLLKNALKKDK
tara:strand:- start:897 stop:1655 length:759 start_codon:yes stop_codon:yes gene_type:complete